MWSFPDASGAFFRLSRQADRRDLGSPPSLKGVDYQIASLRRPSASKLESSPDHHSRLLPEYPRGWKTLNKIRIGIRRAKLK